MPGPARDETGPKRARVDSPQDHADEQEQLRGKRVCHESHSHDDLHHPKGCCPSCAEHTILRDAINAIGTQFNILEERIYALESRPPSAPPPPSASLARIEARSDAVDTRLESVSTQTEVNSADILSLQLGLNASRSVVSRMVELVQRASSSSACANHGADQNLPSKTSEVPPQTQTSQLTHNASKLLTPSDTEDFTTPMDESRMDIDSDDEPLIKKDWSNRSSRLASIAPQSTPRPAIGSNGSNSRAATPREVHFEAVNTISPAEASNVPQPNNVGASPQPAKVTKAQQQVEDSITSQQNATDVASQQEVNTTAGSPSTEACAPPPQVKAISIIASYQPFAKSPSTASQPVVPAAHPLQHEKHASSATKSRSRPVQNCVNSDTLSELERNMRPGQSRSSPPSSDTSDSSSNSSLPFDTEDVIRAGVHIPGERRSSRVPRPTQALAQSHTLAASYRPFENCKGPGHNPGKELLDQDFEMEQ